MPAIPTRLRELLNRMPPPTAEQRTAWRARIEAEQARNTLRWPDDGPVWRPVLNEAQKAQQDADIIRFSMPF